MNTENLKIAFMNIVSPEVTHRVEEYVSKIFDLKGESDSNGNTVVAYDSSVSIASTLNYFLSQLPSGGESVDWDIKDCTDSFEYGSFKYEEEAISIEGVKIVDNEGTAINCVVIYDDSDEAGVIYKILVFDYEYFDIAIGKICNMYYPVKRKGYPSIICSRELFTKVVNITNINGDCINQDDVKNIITNALSIEKYSDIDDYMNQFGIYIADDGLKYEEIEDITCNTVSFGNTVTTYISNDTDSEIKFNAILLFGAGSMYTIYTFDEYETIKVDEPYTITANTKSDELSSNVTIAIMEADDNFEDLRDSLLLIGTASSYHTFLDRLRSILDEYRYEILETRSFKEFKATNGVNTVFELTNGKIEEEKQSDYTDVMLKCCHNIDIGFDSGVIPNNIRTQLIMIAPIALTTEEEE